jgi:hypothetical protein
VYATAHTERTPSRRTAISCSQKAPTQTRSPPSTSRRTTSVAAEDQRYYLESRGIDPSVAERLIVLGFFTDLAAATPISSVGEWFVASVSKRLAAHVGGTTEDSYEAGRV